MSQETIFRTERRTIDGNVVESTVLPALYAVRLKAKLAQKIFPSVGKFLGSIKQDGKKRVSMESVDMAGLSAAFETIVANLTPTELEELLLETLSQTRVNGQESARKEVFNVLFAGNMIFMYKVVAFALEVNFGDFFAVLRTGLPKIRKPAAENPTSNQQ